MDRSTAPLRTFDGLYACSSLLSVEEEIELKMKKKMRKIRRKEIADERSKNFDSERGHNSGNKNNYEGQLNDDDICNTIPNENGCNCLDIYGRVIRYTESSIRLKIPCGLQDCQAPYLLLFSGKGSTSTSQRAATPIENKQQVPKQGKGQAKSIFDFSQDLGSTFRSEKSDVTTVMINTLLNAWTN